MMTQQDILAAAHLNAVRLANHSQALHATGLTEEQEAIVKQLLEQAFIKGAAMVAEVVDERMTKLLDTVRTRA